MVRVVSPVSYSICPSVTNSLNQEQFSSKFTIYRTICLVCNGASLLSGIGQVCLAISLFSLDVSSIEKFFTLMDTQLHWEMELPPFLLDMNKERKVSLNPLKHNLALVLLFNGSIFILTSVIAFLAHKFSSTYLYINCILWNILKCLFLNTLIYFYMTPGLAHFVLPFIIMSQAMDAMLVVIIYYIIKYTRQIKFIEEQNELLDYADKDLSDFHL